MYVGLCHVVVQCGWRPLKGIKCVCLMLCITKRRVTGVDTYGARLLRGDCTRRGGVREVQRGSEMGGRVDIVQDV